MKVFILLSVLLLLGGCYQMHSDDDDLRTIPVTNNPTLLPSQGGMRMPSAPI
jgi:hypothetical protein